MISEAVTPVQMMIHPKRFENLLPGMRLFLFFNIENGKRYSPITCCISFDGIY